MAINLPNSFPPSHKAIPPLTARLVKAAMIIPRLAITKGKLSFDKFAKETVIGSVLEKPEMKLTR